MSAKIIVNHSYDGIESQGIIFAHPNQVKTLQLRGYLILIDATHKTNWLRWLLYTIMVRNKHGY